MNKLKSPKELMAERNPLARKAVEPVDIYSQPTPAEVDTPKKESKQPTEPVQTSSKPKAKKEASSLSERTKQESRQRGCHSRRE